MANMTFGVNLLPKKDGNTYLLGNSDQKWDIFSKNINIISQNIDTTNENVPVTEGNGSLIFKDKNDEPIGIINQEISEGKITTKLSAINYNNGVELENFLKIAIDTNGTASYLISHPAAFRNALGIDNSWAQQNIDLSDYATIDETILKTTFNGPNQLLYSISNGNPAILNAHSESTKQFLIMNGTGENNRAPQWGTITAEDIPSGIPNRKLLNSSITINNSNVPLGGSINLDVVTKFIGDSGDISQTRARELLGLTQTLQFKGKTTSTMTNNQTIIPQDIYTSGTPQIGDVVLDDAGKQYVYLEDSSGSNGHWEILGSNTEQVQIAFESSYPVVIPYNTSKRILKLNGKEIKIKINKPSFADLDLSSGTRTLDDYRITDAVKKSEFTWSEIDGVPPFVSGNARVFYGTCGTAGKTQVKVVTCENYNQIITGDILIVNFTNANTNNQPKLKINGQEKIIQKIYNQDITSLSSPNELQQTSLFYYNGNNWILFNANTDTNTTYTFKLAALGGEDLSLVKTGEKFLWNSKMNGDTTVTNVEFKTNSTNGQYPILFKSVDGSSGTVSYNENIKINPFSGIITGTVTNAISDQDGHQIDSTYAKINNPIFTGTPKITINSSNQNIATENYVNNYISNIDKMTYMGNVPDNLTTTNNKLPLNHTKGEVYKINESGIYAGQQDCEAGDIAICTTSGNNSDNANHWTIVQKHKPGIVTSSITENNVKDQIAIFDATGKVISNSGILINSLTSSSHNHDADYLRINGANYMTGDINILTGINDRFINFWYRDSQIGASTNLGGSWRLGVFGSGEGNGNYFKIQSTTSTLSSNTWKDAMQIGMNDLDVTFGGDVTVASGKKFIGTATKVEVTNTDPTSYTSYYLTYTTSTTTDNQKNLMNSSRLYLYDNSNSGETSYLCVGSSNHSGGLTIRNANGKYANIITSAFSPNNPTLTLPNETGTFALLTREDANELINSLNEGSSTSVLTGEHYIITQYVGTDQTKTGTYYRRKAKNVRVGGLTTAQEIYVDLGSTRDTNNKVTFDGTADKAIHVNGILKTAQGGTGTAIDPVPGGIIYASSSSSYASTDAGDQGSLLQSNVTGKPTWIQATNEKKGNTIVKRDGNGDFKARIITASLIGDASEAQVVNSYNTDFDALQENNGTTTTLYPTIFRVYDTNKKLVGFGRQTIYNNGKISLDLVARNWDTANNYYSNIFSIIIAKDGTCTYSVSNKANFRNAIDAAASTHTHDNYLPITDGKVTDTLILSKTTDLSGTKDNRPALIVGGLVTQPHLELDNNEIQAKSSDNTVGVIGINFDGGNIRLGKDNDQYNVEIRSKKTATSKTDAALVVGGGAGFGGTVYASGFNGPLTGNADTATALTTNAGSSTQPIYFSNGKPVATSYALEAKVNEGSIKNALTYYSGVHGISSLSKIRWAGSNRYLLYFTIHNEAGNKAAEVWYDAGDTINITTGSWKFRSFSPNKPYDDTTTGKHETYSLPAVAEGLTTNKSYNILTTKDLSFSITGNAATSTKAYALANLYDSNSRPNDANITHIANGGITHFKVTTSTNNNPGDDGNILHFHWDTSYAWDSQLLIPDGPGHMHYRGHNSTTTWADWRTLLDSTNYSSYALPLTGGTLSGKLRAVTLETINTTTNGAAIRFLFSDRSNSTYGLMWATRVATYGGRLVFGQYSESSNGALSSHREQYYLPEPERGLSANKDYNILTSKDLSFSITGNAKSADEAKTVIIKTTNPSTSGTVGYLSFSPKTTGNNELNTQDSLYVYDMVSSGNISGTYLNIGNSTITGRLTLHYGNGKGYGNLSLDEIPTGTTRTWTLPNASGTIALTSNNTGITVSLPKGTTSHFVARATGYTGSKNLDVKLTIGSNMMDHGIYSTGYYSADTDTFTVSGKWMIYRNSVGTVTVNGNCTGSASKLATARALYVTLNSVYDINNNVKTFDGSASCAIPITGTLAVGNGGTGKTSWKAGGIVYASAATTLAQISKGENNTVLSITASGAYSWLKYDSGSNASTIVYRDASRNFSAGTITASLNGNANTATTLQTSHSLWGNSFNGSGDIDGTITLGTEKYINARINRKKEDGGGWVFVPLVIRDNANSDFAHIGVFGSANTLSYIYIGSNVYNGNNLRITPNGEVRIPVTTPASSKTTGALTVNGGAGFGGEVHANKFVGPLDGNAATATSATTATRAKITSNKYGIAYYLDNIGTFSTTTYGTAGYILQGGGSNNPPSWINATDQSDANTIVRRDGSGNFSAGTITANLKGTADKATLATKATGDSAGNTINTTYAKLSGATFTGNITITKAGEAYVYSKNSSTGNTVYLNSGSGSSHGIWSSGYYNGSSYISSGKWLIYRNDKGKVIVNGDCTGNAVTATTATTAGYATTAGHATTAKTAEEATSATFATTANTAAQWNKGQIVYVKLGLASKNESINCKQDNSSIGIGVDGTLPVANGGTGQTSIPNIKAGKDGDGNTISSTYLKLDGSSTMTGALKMLAGNSTITIQGKYAKLADAYRNYIDINNWLNAVGVVGAVWNDYAEFRKTNKKAKAGQAVIDNDDGSLSITDKRLMPGAQIVSDTFGFSIGETEEAKTPLAVSGRVLAYTYRPREEYHAGMAVCSAPDGTIDIMTREEIQQYPDAIIGIVSEIPDYEEWGTGKVKVNKRIWIKIK